MKKALIVVATISIVLIIGTMIMGCSPEAKYEKEFRKIYYKYYETMDILVKADELNKQYPENAPEDYDDTWFYKNALNLQQVFLRI